MKVLRRDRMELMAYKVLPVCKADKVPRRPCRGSKAPWVFGKAVPLLVLDIGLLFGQHSLKTAFAVPWMDRFHTGCKPVRLRLFVQRMEYLYPLGSRRQRHSPAWSALD